MSRRRIARIRDIRDQIELLETEVHLEAEEIGRLSDTKALLDELEEELVLEDEERELRNRASAKALDAQAERRAGTAGRVYFELQNAEDLETDDWFIEAKTGDLVKDDPGARKMERVGSISVPANKPSKVLLETTSGRKRYVAAHRWVWVLRRDED